MRQNVYNCRPQMWRITMNEQSTKFKATKQKFTFITDSPHKRKCSKEARARKETKL